jgi:hypothetical protein
MGKVRVENRAIRVRKIAERHASIACGGWLVEKFEANEEETSLLVVSAQGY